MDLKIKYKNKNSFPVSLDKNNDSNNDNNNCKNMCREITAFLQHD